MGNDCLGLIRRQHGFENGLGAFLLTPFRGVFFRGINFFRGCGGRFFIKGGVTRVTRDNRDIA